MLQSGKWRVNEDTEGRVSLPSRALGHMVSLGEEMPRRGCPFTVGRELIVIGENLKAEPTEKTTNQSFSVVTATAIDHMSVMALLLPQQPQRETSRNYNREAFPNQLGSVCRTLSAPPTCGFSFSWFFVKVSERIEHRPVHFSTSSIMKTWV